MTQSRISCGSLQFCHPVQKLYSRDKHNREMAFRGSVTINLAGPAHSYATLDLEPAVSHEHPIVQRKVHLLAANDAHSCPSSFCTRFSAFFWIR